jgi:hypothetical protein
MTCVLEKCFTQTDPMPRGAGSVYEAPYVYVSDMPTVMTDPSGLRGSYHTSAADVEASNPPAGTRAAMFSIPKWPGYGVSRMQFFINDDEVCLVPKVAPTCGHGDNRSFAAGSQIGDYNLPSRVRIVLDHERGSATVLSYPTHNTDGSSTPALPVIHVDNPKNPIPPKFPSSVRTLDSSSSSFSFDYLFYNSKAGPNTDGLAPGVYGSHTVAKAGSGMVGFSGCLGRYPSLEIIRDRGDGAGAYNSSLIYTRQQESGSPKALFYPCTSYGVKG